MCTTDELKRSMDECKASLEKNTKQQVETHILLASFIAASDTWQRVRCEDHHDRIESLEEVVAGQEKAMARAAGKSAGLIGGAMLVLQLISLGVAWGLLHPAGG